MIEQVNKLLAEGKYRDAYAMGTSLDWAEAFDLIPEHMQHGMALYVLCGVEPGGFLGSVMSNDLMGALGKADSVNVSRLANYGQFLYNYVPAECYGSPDRYREWLNTGGLMGRIAKAEEVSDG